MKNPPCVGIRRIDCRQPEAEPAPRTFGCHCRLTPSTAFVPPTADPAPKKPGRSAAPIQPAPKPQPKKESLIGKHRTQRLSDITADERLPQDIRTFLASLEK